MVISRLVLKLGVVRFATSFLVVLLANVLNRVLIVDLTVPAALVTFSFAFQHVMTPVGLVTGYFSDTHPLRGRHRSPYIWGGMLLSVAVMPFFPDWALALGAQPQSRPLLYQGVLLFSLFGIGTTVSATAINALLVDRVPERDRGSALTMVWILTLLGFIVGSALAGVLFPAFDPDKIHQLFVVVTLVVVAVTLWGAWGIEPRCEGAPDHQHGQMRLWPTLKFLASNRQALAFFAFLGTSIFFLAIQTFLLTAYGGEVLALPVAQTSRFGIYTTYGILAGMVGVHLLVSARQNWANKIVLVVSLVVGAAAFGLLSLTSFTPEPHLGHLCPLSPGAGPRLLQRGAVPPDHEHGPPHLQRGLHGLVESGQRPGPGRGGNDRGIPQRPARLSFGQRGRGLWLGVFARRGGVAGLPPVPGAPEPGEIPAPTGGAGGR